MVIVCPPLSLPALGCPGELLRVDAARSALVLCQPQSFVSPLHFDPTASCGNALMMLL